MNSIEQVQTLFFRCVRFDPAPRELEDVFLDGARLSARESMAVYRDMYWFRQVDALFDVFPRLAERLGTERFTKLCCRYLTAEPSTHPELERLGHALPRFVREAAEIGDDRECLADLAALELAALETLLAPASGPVLGLEGIDPNRFPHQSLILTRAHALLTVGDDALAAFRGESAIGRAARRHVLFTRPVFGILHRILDDDEAAALELARRGLCVEAVCGPFASPERASTVLRRWFEDALVLSLSESS